MDREVMSHTANAPKAGDMGHEHFDDQRMELIMGRLLQVGVLLSAAVIFVGGVLYVIGHAGEPMDFRVFRPRPVDVRQPGELVRRVLNGDARGIVQLGLLLLIATPVCRVLFAVIAFLLEKDWVYVAVSVTVLAVLLFGLFRAG